MATALPAVTLRLLDLTGQVDLAEQPELSAIAFGGAIIGMAFVLAWATEVVQLDISQALALAFVALIAVLPEYAVDLYFAWQAGQDPQYLAYPAANMTGANRLLVGIGWPLVALLFWSKTRRSLFLGQGLSLELLFLGIAVLYSFSFFFKSSIALWDMLPLVALFAAYIWLSARAEHQEPELIGPSAAIGALPPRTRRTVVAALFLLSAGVIVASAEPFVEGLLETGAGLGIDEFVLVQWVAPLASESPEMLIAAIFTLRGQAGAAMTTLISATFNQWTLLAGTLPLVYSISLGHAAALPLDLRQSHEFLLTSSQALFAVVLLVRLRVSWRSGLALLLLFVVQLFAPLYPDVSLGPLSIQDRQFYAWVYLAFALVLIMADRGRVRELWRLAPTVYSTLVRPRSTR